jgi:uncharacterized protein YegP (UPF0339 family)
MSKVCWSVGLVVLLISWLGTPGDICLCPSGVSIAQAGEGKLKFELYTDKAKEYRWRLKAANGAILATGGQGYTAKADAKSAVDNLIKDVSKYNFEVYEDKAKEFRWRLKAKNGQVVGASSEGYAARAGVEAAIDLIKKNVAKAAVE